VRSFAMGKKDKIVQPKIGPGQMWAERHQPKVQPLAQPALSTKELPGYTAPVDYNPVVNYIPWARLEVLKDKKRVDVVKLGGKDAFMFGREEGYVDIECLHPSVSRRHAIIYREDGALFLKDLHSAQGTFIDGKKIQPNIALSIHEGTKITFGCSSRVYICRLSRMFNVAKRPHEPEEEVYIKEEAPKRRKVEIVVERRELTDEQKKRIMAAKERLEAAGRAAAKKAGEKQLGTVDVGSPKHRSKSPTSRSREASAARAKSSPPPEASVEADDAAGPAPAGGETPK